MHNEEKQNLTPPPTNLSMFKPETRKIIYLDVGDAAAKPNEEQDFENDPRYKVWGLPIVEWHDMRTILAAVGFGSQLLRNYMYRRPPFASLPLHIIAAAAGWYCGSCINKYRYNRALRNELVIWDYVKRHPEDFPEVFERPKKFKDILRPWHPHR